MRTSRMAFCHFVYLFLPLFLYTMHATAQNLPINRKVVVTVDDLPKGGTLLGAEHIAYINEQLLAVLTERGIPAIGFVNESKCYDEAGNTIDSQLQMLRNWAAAGLELGNHGYQHLDINRVPVEKYLSDIKAGEPLSKALLQEFKLPCRYYRHPFLHRRNTDAKRATLAAYLAAQGNTEAPVTVDNQEWIYNAAYEKAFKEGQDSLAAAIGEDYVQYMIAMQRYYESQSEMLFGRNIDHSMLIHVNRLNADYFELLVEEYENLGYSFISLEEALKDPAYQHTDDFVGNAGITWLHRWAITDGKRGSFFAGEPTAPDWVKSYAGY